MANGAREGIEQRASQAVARRSEQPAIYRRIETQEAEVARALPAHLKQNAAAYTRALITVMKQTPALVNCDPNTILGGLMTASQLGLEFGPLGAVYMVPYGNRAQLIVGYKGLIDLAWRSGRLKSIEAREVKEYDEFDYSYGLEPKLVHKPTLNGDGGRTIAYYGVAQFKDGGSYYVVVSPSEIEEHRKRSKSANNGPWKTDYKAMALKTVIRIMQPYLPLTTEVAHQMTMDGVVASGTRADAIETEQVDYIDAEAVDVETGEIEPAAQQPIEYAPGDEPFEAES